MEFSIGSQFSREFTFEESSITRKLSDELNNAFDNNDYGERIKKIYVGIICVSKGFDSFFMVRPTKILKKEPALEFEIKLNFDAFKKEEELERKKIIVKEVLKLLKGIIQEKTINNFKKEVFITDLEDFFKEQGYLE